MANPNKTNVQIFRELGLEVMNGKNILYRPIVQAALKERQEQACLDSRITLRRVMLEETCVAFSDLVDLFSPEGTMLSPEKIPEKMRRAIAGIEVIELRKREGEPQTYKYKYKLWDKGKSLERISKHLGLYEKDNVQKAVRMYFLRADDEKVPEIEVEPDTVEAEFTKLKGKAPVALLE